MDKIQIFISYAREDQPRIKALYEKLVAAGYQPWLDREHIVPGQRWQPIIKQALKRSDFVLVCLSLTSINKRGFLWKEIKQALEQADEKLEDDVWLIPVRLDDCETPDALSAIQWVDLFEPQGFDDLLRALAFQLKRTDKTVPAPPSQEQAQSRSQIPPAPLQLPVSTTPGDTADPVKAPDSKAVNVPEPPRVERPPAEVEPPPQTPQLMQSPPASARTLSEEPNRKPLAHRPPAAKPLIKAGGDARPSKLRLSFATSRSRAAVTTAGLIVVLLIGIGFAYWLTSNREMAKQGPAGGNPAPIVAQVCPPGMKCPPPKTPSKPNDRNKTGPERPVLPRVTWPQFVTARLDERGDVLSYEVNRANAFTEGLGTGVTLEMVKLDGGEFWMGSSEAEAQVTFAEAKRHFSDAKQEWYAIEMPRHRVKVSPFSMGKYEVTQAQWRAVMGGLPDISNERGDNYPVVNVSWTEAVDFCQKLSSRTNKRYRLPTEAEWEYAARAGTLTAFAFGPTITPQIANYDGNYPYGSVLKGIDRNKTVPVGSLGVANAFGLFDLHGNVWEWCSDWYDAGYYKQSAATDPQGPASGSHRVLRGGGWGEAAVNCRSANRYSGAPGLRNDGFGFRLVRVGP